MRRLLPLFLLTLVALLVAGSRLSAQENRPADFVVGPTDLGVAFINSVGTPSSPTRIQRGVNSGAALDRFPFYWHDIEPQPGQFAFGAVDAVVRANEAQGLGTLAILLGTPQFYYPPPPPDGFSATEMPPVGGGPLRQLAPIPMGADGECGAGTPPAIRLYEPIFSDGTDIPGPGKQINANNPWARYIFTTVNHYRPGGTAGTQVRYWEVWNEPDLCHFWGGTTGDYARLLKVAYLAIEQADPQATVMWGGLAHYGAKYENGRHFLNELVAALRNDPLAAQFGGFFDAAASHQYSTMTLGYTYTTRIRSALAGTGWQSKPVWITESGVPVCGSYPGPACPTAWRANAEGQASFVWQNIAYTRIANNNAPIFFFQLHDDCGNDPLPAPPADAFGLVTNDAASWCTPHTAQPRLAYSAHQLAAQYLSETTLIAADIQDGRVRRATFRHDPTGERRVMLWTTSEQPWTARVSATNSSAQLLGLDGTITTIFPTNGEYHVPLTGSTNMPRFSGDTFIGGRPFLLMESPSSPTPTPTPTPTPFPVIVSGQVVTTANQPAPWAHVQVGESGLFADAQGNFSFTTLTGERDFHLQSELYVRGQQLTGPLTGIKLALPPEPNTVTNGDFESGTSGWQLWGSSPSALQPRPQTNDLAMTLATAFVPNPGVPGTGGGCCGGNATVSQIVQIPAGSPHLGLYFRVASGETTAGGACTNPNVHQDKFEVILFDVDAQGNPIGRHPLHCQELGSSFAFYSFDLTPFAGRRMMLAFNVYESSAERRTSALVDHVMIGTSPTLTPPQPSYLPVIAR